MGNGIGKLTVCFTGNNGGGRRKHDISILITEPLDEGLGHSFCYVRPDPTRISSSKVHSEETTTFRAISGASVSANTSTPLSTAFVDLYSYGCIDRAAAFESSTLFASLPLQPIPRNLLNSGPFSGNLGGGGFPSSGPLERGFMSGPIERGFMSGPIDRGLFSGPMEREGNGSDHFPRSFSHGGLGLGLGLGLRVRTRKGRWIRVLRRAISKTLSRGQNSIVAPIKGVVVKEPEWMVAAAEKHNENLSVNLSSEGSLEDDDSMESQNLQWAQGKAGEDRVHVVVSEEHGWVFVGIYDGFNGPDAPDYLLSNLYTAVHKELKGLLWDDGSAPENSMPKEDVLRGVTNVAGVKDVDACFHCVEQENNDCYKSTNKKVRNSRNKYKGAANKWEENQRRWKCEWDRERLELDRRLKEQLNLSRSGSGGAVSSINHADVLEALSRALRKTEESYLDVAYSVTDKPIAIKDNICTKQLKTTASSGILKDFTSPYDATVVKLLQDEGAVVVGKTNMDEFGMGSHSTHSHFGPVKMQRYDGEEASVGGSSGGSALAVATSQCWAALGTDTGGSVRLPAAYTSVIGFKPSYGLISRWGVIAYANSLDTVGIFGRNVAGVKHIFDKLNIHDARDPTSVSNTTRAKFRAESRPTSLRIGVPLDYNIDTLQPAVRKAWLLRLRHLWDRGHTLHPVRLPTTQQALSAYYVLGPAEASSNFAKYDGVRFGSRAPGIDGTPDSVLFAKTRGQGFGPEVQRRILLGAFSLSAQAMDNYFIQAQKVRRLVQQDFNRVFALPNPLFDSEVPLSKTEGVDVIICPTAPSTAPSLAEVKTQDPLHSYMNDVFTVPASLAGLPAITLPTAAPYNEEKSENSGSPDPFFNTIGLQIIGQYGDDQLVLDTAKILEEITSTPQNRTGPEVDAWGSGAKSDT